MMQLSPDGQWYLSDGASDWEPVPDFGLSQAEHDFIVQHSGGLAAPWVDATGFAIIEKIATSTGDPLAYDVYVFSRAVFFTARFQSNVDIDHGVMFLEELLHFDSQFPGVIDAVGSREHATALRLALLDPDAERAAEAKWEVWTFANKIYETLDPMLRQYRDGWWEPLIALYQQTHPVALQQHAAAQQSSPTTAVDRGRTDVHSAYADNANAASPQAAPVARGRTDVHSAYADNANAASQPATAGAAGAQAAQPTDHYSAIPSLSDAHAAQPAGHSAAAAPSGPHPPAVDHAHELNSAWLQTWLTPVPTGETVSTGYYNFGKHVIVGPHHEESTYEWLRSLPDSGRGEITFRRNLVGANEFTVTPSKDANPDAVVNELRAILGRGDSYPFRDASRVTIHLGAMPTEPRLPTETTASPDLGRLLERNSANVAEWLGGVEPGETVDAVYHDVGFYVMIGEHHDRATWGWLRSLPSYGQGRVTFKRNRVGANEFIITPGSGSNPDAVINELRTILSNGGSYPYRDASRVTFHVGQEPSQPAAAPASRTAADALAASGAGRPDPAALAAENARHFQQFVTGVDSGDTRRLGYWIADDVFSLGDTDAVPWIVAQRDRAGEGYIEFRRNRATANEFAVVAHTRPQRIPDVHSYLKQWCLDAALYPYRDGSRVKMR